jgi:hypothetical protein
LGKNEGRKEMTVEGESGCERIVDSKTLLPSEKKCKIEKLFLDS